MAAEGKDPDGPGPGGRAAEGKRGRTRGRATAATRGGGRRRESGAGRGAGRRVPAFDAFGRPCCLGPAARRSKEALVRLSTEEECAREHSWEPSYERLRALVGAGIKGLK